LTFLPSVPKRVWQALPPAKVRPVESACRRPAPTRLRLRWACPAERQLALLHRERQPDRRHRRPRLRDPL